jgi:hypothetical protein
MTGCSRDGSRLSIAITDEHAKSGPFKLDRFGKSCLEGERTRGLCSSFLGVNTLIGVMRQKGKYAVKWTRLSWRNFKDNQARLQLLALAYNLGNFMRRLAQPGSVRHWSLTTLREKLIKIGAKVVTHSRYVIFQMAEVAVPHALFAAILERIQGFGVPPPLVQRG